MNTVLNREQWEDSQKNESAFWKSQLAVNNTEQQGRNGWYRYHVFPHWFSHHSFANQIVVDVGSGPRGILYTIEDAKLLIAVDPLMDTFRQQGYILNDKKVRSVSGSAEAIPLADNMADVVFSLNMLDHVQNPEKCLEEMHRILVVGGTLVLCVDMRPTELLDAYHKLQLVDEWLKCELERIKFKGKYYYVPHQTGNPTIQFCATVIK